jgi:hypothetical protein
LKNFGKCILKFLFKGKNRILGGEKETCGLGWEIFLDVLGLYCSPLGFFLH